MHGEPVVGQVVGDPPRHAFDAEPVLDQKRGLEAEDQQPRVQLAEPFTQWGVRRLSVVRGVPRERQPSWEDHQFEGGSLAGND